MHRSIHIVVAALLSGLGAARAAHAAPDGISLPPGFTLEIYAEGVANARSLARGEDGTVYVGTRKAGKVYALPDRDGDHRADRVVVIAANLDTPNGVAMHRGALYVVERRRVLRFADIAERLDKRPLAQVIHDGLPDENHHGWRYARFGPDGKLYIGVGAPCNACDADPARYALIERMNPDGSEREVFARGVRNGAGFDWHPRTGQLWFTDNGRLWMGDDYPPDELNRAPRAGLHFGYPYCHGAAIPDPTFGAHEDCAAFTPPARVLQAHAAALGMRFYTAHRFPPRYRGGIFIAEYGSWMRTPPSGYRISFVPLHGDCPAGYEVFAEGWLRHGRAQGRPVDVLVTPDGALLVSDDVAGAIYRIAYRGKAGA